MKEILFVLPVGTAERAIVGETRSGATGREGLMWSWHVVAVQRSDPGTTRTIGIRSAWGRWPGNVVARRCRTWATRWRWDNGCGSRWYVVTITHIASSAAIDRILWSRSQATWNIKRHRLKKVAAERRLQCPKVKSNFHCFFLQLESHSITNEVLITNENMWHSQPFQIRIFFIFITGQWVRY